MLLESLAISLTFLKLFKKNIKNIRFIKIPDFVLLIEMDI